VSEEIYKKLRPWQPAIVEATIHGLESGNFLNASGLGSGKTFTSLASVLAMRKKAIAICRQTAMSMWREVAESHFNFDPSNIHAINREQLRTGKHWLGYWRERDYNPNTGKTSREFVWNVPADSVLIFDEIHCEAGLTSQASGMLRDAVRQGVKILGLSGTTADDPRKMRAIGYMLGLHNDTDFWQWLALQGASETSWDFGLPQNYLGSKKGKLELQYRQESAMSRIREGLIKQGRMIRIPTSQIPGFPKCTIQPQCLKFDSKRLAAIHEEMKAEFDKLRDKGPSKGLGALMPLLEKAELEMVPELVESTQDAIEEGNSVVNFVNFKSTVRALSERLKTDCTYTGDNVDKREGCRLAFERDDERVINVTAGAGSESVSFADRRGEFPRLGQIIPSFQAIVLNQLLGRLPRDGAKTPSVYRILFASGGWQQKAYKACQRRTELYGAFNGDVRFTDEDLLEGLV
jgi:hypothetical protein